jgi:hypothetical protein
LLARNKFPAVIDEKWWISIEPRNSVLQHLTKIPNKCQSGLGELFEYHFVPV